MYGPASPPSLAARLDPTSASGAVNHLSDTSQSSIDEIDLSSVSLFASDASTFNLTSQPRVQLVVEFTAPTDGQWLSLGRPAKAVFSLIELQASAGLAK
jgi:hypothetical protein